MTIKLAGDISRQGAMTQIGEVMIEPIDKVKLATTFDWLYPMGRLTRELGIVAVCVGGKRCGGLN